MRTFIVLISLAVSAFGLPVDDENLFETTRAIDYEVLQAKLNELREVTLGCSDDEKKIAINDHSEAGKQISDLIDIDTAKQTHIYDELETKIKDKTVTITDARKCVDQLKEQYLTTKAALKPHCIKLSKKAQEEMKALFKTTSTKGDELIQRIYELCVPATGKA